METYIVMERLASQDGSQVWVAGQFIELDPVRAAILLSKGVIRRPETEHPAAQPAPEPQQAPQLAAQPDEEPTEKTAPVEKKKKV